MSIDISAPECVPLLSVVGEVSEAHELKHGHTEAEDICRREMRKIFMVVEDLSRHVLPIAFADLLTLREVGGSAKPKISELEFS